MDDRGVKRRVTQAIVPASLQAGPISSSPHRRTGDRCSLQSTQTGLSASQPACPAGKMPALR